MVAFYIAAGIALLATLIAMTRAHAVHALLYVVISLLSVAVDFYLLGAPFIAALEAIIYAGAVMVLFLYAIMLLELRGERLGAERRLLRPAVWVLPTLLAAALAFEVAWVLARGGPQGIAGRVVVPPRAVGRALGGPYLLGVEIASLLLLAGLVGANHLARRGEGETDPP